MNISEGFIKRPIATSLLMAAIALFGLVAYRELPVSDLPNVDFPTLLVTAQLPGANPETMGASVATPLENQFSTISGLEQMTSVNSLGSTQITLEFALDRGLDGAAVDVQGAITQASRLLPQGMPTPPVFTKVNPADQPILYLVVTSSTLPPWTLDEYAETRIAQRISQVSGVAQVQVLGGRKYAMHAQLDPHALAVRQIGINEVEAALRNWNVNVPTGSIIGPHQVFTLQASGQLMNADQYRNQIISYRDNAPVRLEQLGSIVDGVEDQRTGSWYYTSQGKQSAITLGIQRQPGTNTIAVSDAVKALLPQFRAELPASVHLDMLYDRSDTIRESYHDVQFTMALTLALVILVIFIFLRNVWATAIPSLALPFSIIGTFSLMYFLHYSLDNLSMMALILSVGFVVDDAIVMLENIFRHVEMGEDPLQASLVGSREIGFTIVSMTLSLAAVFIPVLFMGGVLGRLFREFAVTICVAILISGVVSVTLTPMLCSRFLKKPHKHGEGGRSRFYDVTERSFQSWLRAYDRTLQIVMRHRPATMAAFALMLVLTGVLFVIVPKGFIPDQDASQISVVTEAAQGTSYDKLVEYQDRVADIVRRDPAVAGLVSTIGGNASMTLGGPNLGQLVVTLKPRSERTQSVNEVIERLRPELDQVAGMQTYMQNPPTIRIGAQVSKSLYQYSMQSPDKAALYATARALRSRLADLPGLQDVTSDLEIASPQVSVEIDRDKAAALGVTANQIESAFYDAYGPRWVSTIYGTVNEYKVLLELAPEFQQDPSALSMLYFKGPGPNSPVVPLDTLASLKQDVGPQTVNHYGQLPAVTISFGLAPGASLGDVLRRVREVTATTVPDGVTGQFQGAAAAFQGALSNLAVLLVIAVLVVYIVLGILYESYIHPLTILSGLPSAAFGALLTLIIFHMDLNIYAFVGMIMLIGIVEKNAIMQIDFALEAERSGMSPDQAIYQGCLIRFRPIMMTTMAALLGAVPIAVGYGAGGEARQPLGLVVVGGLIFSQLVTLYLTPVFFTYMAQLQNRLNHPKAIPGVNAVARFSVILLALGVTAHGVSAKDALPKLFSEWSSSEVQWDKPAIGATHMTQFTEKSPFEISLRNDSDFLYVLLRTSDATMRTRMLREGLVVWFDPKGGSKKEIGIQYPSGQRGGGRSGGYRDRQRPTDTESMWAQAESDGALGAMEVLGPKKDDRLRLVVANTEDPKVKITSAEGTVTYQLRVPLSAGGEYHHAIQTTPGSIIGIGLSTPDLEEGAGRSVMGGGRGGGRGGRGGYRGGQGQSFERPSPLKEWSTIKLAGAPGR